MKMDLSFKKVETPSDATLYPITRAQELLLWSQIFAVERRKAQEDNMLSMTVTAPAEEGAAEALEKAYNLLLERHDALRTTIIKKGGKKLQFIRPFKPVTLPVYSFATEEECRAWLEEMNHFIIPWYGTELCLAAMLKHGDKVTLALRFNHAIADGYSFGIAFRELKEAYHAFMEDREPVLKPAVSITKYCADEAAYRASVEHTEDMAYWKKVFHHQRKYSFPAGYTSPLGDVSAVGTLFEGADYERLARLAEYCHLSIQSVVQPLAALTVYALTGKDNFCFYTMTHGRRTPAQKRTFGCMMNTVPVFFDFENKDASVAEAISGQYMRYLDYLAHGKLPMGDLVPMGYRESFKHFMNFNHGWMVYSTMDMAASAADPVLEIRAMPFTHQAQQFYASILEVPGKSMKVNLTYQIHKYKKEQAESYVAAFRKLTDIVAENPEITLAAIRKAFEA